MKRFLLICFTFVFAVLLWGCSQESVEKVIPMPTTEAPTTEPPVEELTLVVTTANIGDLENYPDLKRVDLTGSTCYAAIEEYIAAHPEVEVIYTVSLGGTEVSPDVQKLELTAGSFDYSTLQDSLPHLPNVQSVYFQDMELSLEDYVNFRNMFPALEMGYDVELDGQTLDGMAESADFSDMTAETIEGFAARLELLPALSEIELMKADGTTDFTLEEVAELQKLVPGAVCHYSFDLWGQTISTTDEEVKYANRYIGNQIEGAEDQLRQALSVMKGCKRFILDNCHFDNETLAAIRDEYRNVTKLVWRVWFGPDGSCLTDREVIRYMPTLTGDGSANLIYCEDARFIDVGHNEALFNCDFVAKMTKLEAIIISGAPVKDMSAFAGCESLEFLELAYCAYVDDISAVAQCKNLKRINISYTGVSDLSPLDELDLEIMVDTHSKVSSEERERFESLHPDCLTLHTTEQPYGYPWRYTEDGKYNDYYLMLREIFNYDNPSQTRW